LPQQKFVATQATRVKRITVRELLRLLARFGESQKIEEAASASEAAPFEIAARSVS
jgi:hypothetical protein